jgi:uncharacterized protein YecA (UPF0149 family)
MPTLEYYRIWCKKCKDWELHKQKYPDWKEWFCKECDTKHESVLLSEIPKDKILEQRERYNQKEKENTNKFFGEFMMSPEQRRVKEIVHMFSEPGSDIEIIESDAGQKEIDKKIREKRAKIVEQKRQEKEKVKEELLKYKGLQRNDLCACGSGKKYKKCCLEGVNSLLIEHNLRF